MERTRERIALLVALVIVSLLAIQAPPLPHPVPVSAPADQFSAERAMAHVAVIARAPHPVGSESHSEVEQYLLNQIRLLGLQPQVQAGAGESYVHSTLLSAPVRNIIVRLPGQIHADPVMLVGHYDSKLAAPGAADDGHAIAVLLETLRALRSGPILRHDLIFLMTDGEEVDLLGADVFVKAHAWGHEPSLVLNFEARGTGGVPQMFETSAGNGGIIRHLAEAVPDADATSFAYEVYRRLPNDTDMTVFKRAGLAGLNFAFIGHPEFYHTERDDPGHLDRRSVQRQGDYALRLARHFGNAEPDWKGKPDVIFFRPSLLPLIIYPAAWAVPLAVLSIFAVCMSIVLVARRQYLSLRAFLVGLAIFPLWVFLVAFLNSGLFWLIRTADSAYSTFGYGFTYNQPWYGASATFLSLAVSTAGLVLFGRSNRGREFAAACLVWQMPLLLFTAIAAPGASYLLQWPLLFGAASYLVLCRRIALRASALIAIAVMLAIPALVLLGATIRGAFTGLGLGGLPILMVLLVLLFAVISPQLQSIHLSNWAAPGTLALISAFLFCIALFRPGFDRDRPRQVQISYFLDSDRGQANWVARPHALSAFEQQYFGKDAVVTTSPRLVPPIFGQMQILQRQAPVSFVAVPEARLVSDQSTDLERRLQLHIVPGRKAYSILAWAEEGSLRSASIGGAALQPEPIQGENRPLSLVACYGFPESGFDVSLIAAGKKPLRLRIEMISKGLPQLSGFSSQLSDRALMPVQERPPLFPAFSTVTSRLVTF